MTESEKITEAEPRYINGRTQPVYVERPDGSDRVVRPYRELGAVAGRREEDCVVVGAHYSRFSGLLEPFPGTDAPIAIPADTKDPMDPNDRGVAARAMASSQFKAEGEVVSPGGKVKHDNPEDDTTPTPAEEPTTEDDKPEAPVVTDAEETEDAELTAIGGIGRKLDENLKAAGIATAAKLANQQDEAQLDALVKVPGVRNREHAAELVTNAQELLGWEDAD